MSSYGHRSVERGLADCRMPARLRGALHMSSLGELDVLDVVALALAVQGELATDDLDHLGMATLGEDIGGLAGIEGGGVEHRALDELVSFEGCVRLLHHAVVHIGFADDDGGLEMVGETAQMANVLAGESHRNRLPFAVAD